MGRNVVTSMNCRYFNLTTTIGSVGNTLNMAPILGILDTVCTEAAFVATRASALRNSGNISYESVRFHTRKGKKSERNGVETWEKKPKIREEVPDMKKLRYEIIKFGTSGFKGEEKEEANVAMMVSLGAEPPKKPKKNYKELMFEKKKEKERQRYEDEINGRKYKPSVKKGGSQGGFGKKGKKDVKGLLDVYGEVNKKKKMMAMKKVKKTKR